MNNFRWYNRDVCKAIEELNELSTVLMQQYNKPNKDFSKHIIEEMGDVIFRLDNLKSYYDTVKIEQRVKFKRDKVNKNEN